MLVLTRKLNQKLVFPGTSTTVEVVDIKGGHVRLGVDAPPDVEVWREELMAGMRRAQATPRNDWRDVERLIDKRLSLAGQGLALLRGHLGGDALLTLDEVAAELDLLRDRVRCEAGGKSVAGTSGTRPKALLVEDNPQERELLALFLRREGLDVDTAGDGADAIEYLTSHARPDMLLLDMALPRLDGPATVSEVRRNPACAGLKIFAVSGHAPGEYNLVIGPAGVDYWFQKPVDPVTLVRDISRELAKA